MKFICKKLANSVLRRWKNDGQRDKINIFWKEILALLKKIIKCIFWIYLWMTKRFMKDESPCHPSYTYFKKNDATTYVRMCVLNINHTKKEHLQTQGYTMLLQYKMYSYSQLCLLWKKSFSEKKPLKNCKLSSKLDHKLFKWLCWRMEKSNKTSQQF